MSTSGGTHKADHESIWLLLRFFPEIFRHGGLVSEEMGDSLWY